jgi:hypothetical protein
MVLAVVYCELVLDTVQLKTALGNSITVAADDGAEVWVVLF